MNKKEAYFILISTFILIVAWIIFSILQSAVSSTISGSLSLQTTPINPTFDMQTITAIKKRKAVTPATEIQTNIATNAAQSITPTPQAQQSATTGTVSAIPNIQIP